MVVAEIPRLATDVIGGGAEHGALDGHPAMRRVVVPRGQQPLDRQPEEHDPASLTVDEPARYLVGDVVGGHGTDLETHLLQFGPGAAEELDSRAHGEIEPVDPGLERCERRAHDLAAAETAVPTVTRTAARCCRGASGAATRHDESLGGAFAARRGIRPSSCAAGTLTVMDGRLCSKVGCAREAVATITYDYGDQMAALGPLGIANHPHAHDLCSPHADRVSVPAGWLIVRHEALRA